MTRARTDPRRLGSDARPDRGASPPVLFLIVGLSGVLGEAGSRHGTRPQELPAKVAIVFHRLPSGQESGLILGMDCHDHQERQRASMWVIRTGCAAATVRGDRKGAIPAWAPALTDLLDCGRGMLVAELVGSDARRAVLDRLGAGFPLVVPRRPPVFAAFRRNRLTHGVSEFSSLRVPPTPARAPGTAQSVRPPPPAKSPVVVCAAWPRWSTSPTCVAS